MFWGKAICLLAESSMSRLIPRRSWQIASLVLSKAALQQLIDYLSSFTKQQQHSDSSFLNANIFWFIYSSVTVYSTSLGCGQNKSFNQENNRQINQQRK